MARLIRRLAFADVQMNKPLEFAIYDQAGNLILRKGFVISMPGFAEKLVSRGYYVGEASEVAGGASRPGPASATTATVLASSQARKVSEPTFSLVSDFIHAVSRIHKIILSPPSNLANIEELVKARATQLIELLKKDSDAVIAALYLSQLGQEIRACKHALGAAIAYLIAEKIGTDDLLLHSLVCASLTRDVSLYYFDNAIPPRQGVSPFEEKGLREHTLTAVKLLEKHGVKNRDWLRFVFEHHERPDGNGYPVGKKIGDIHELSLLIALADSYAAMVISNKWRSGIFPANSLKEVYMEKKDRYLESHIAALIKTLTRFPAGTIVALNSGEVGVVKTTTHNRKSPLAYVIYDDKGFPKSESVMRDTMHSQYGIRGCVSPERCKTAMLAIKRIWIE